MLTLTEELMLLALHDEKGSIVVFADDSLPQGLAGAIILDLIFMKKISFENHHIKLIDKKSTNNAVLDKALKMIKKESKEKEIKHWMAKLVSDEKDIKDAVLKNLVNEGILRKEEHKMFLLISSNRFPTENPDPEDEIRHGIRDVILKNKTPDDARWTLISLVKACDLVKEVFHDNERTTANKRISEITSKEEVEKTISPMIAESTEIITKLIVSSNITSSSLAGL